MIHWQDSLPIPLKKNSKHGIIWESFVLKRKDCLADRCTIPFFKCTALALRVLEILRGKWSLKVVFDGANVLVPLIFH